MPLRANKTDRRMLATFIFLSVFELPVLWLGSHSIGLFDLYLIVFDLYLILRTRGVAGWMSWQWRTYFLLFFGYLVYLSFHLVYYHDFRGTMVAVKTAETMTIMFTFYLVFSRFTFERKSVVRMIAVTGILLALFQVASFFRLTTHFGILPGFGIGQWYRVGLPFIKGVSSDPAGAAAGLMILFALFARRERDLKRSTFLFLVFLTVLALVLTISRTNILALFVVLVLYLLRRSIKRSRYFYILATLITVLAIAVDVLDNTLPQQSAFFHIIDLVRHPSQFLSQVGSDKSFSIRYKILWPLEYQAWIRNPFTFFFGNGIRFIPISDNTYLGLLANQGLIGLLWFVYLWYAFFLFAWSARLPYLWVVLLFVFIGGGTGDTLVTSYRTIQIYLPILFFFLFEYGGLRDRHVGVSHHPLL